MRVELKAFDTLSEVSDCTTAGTSLSGRDSIYGDSREDLQDLTNKLGPELFDERFRVDRRKLEQMLMGGNGAQISAEEFFKKIQDDTDTLVIWPSRLKVGAKSKKDPNIRIAGRKGDVKAAKEMVIAVLDARGNRVTMKLDVSYTDHSHIIGRKGETIQRVMKDTKCHIHFPDSNRNNPTEKSNQVSIAGDLDGVEAARESVRNLTPLIFSFELPIVGCVQPMIDSSSPELHNIQENYNVQVSFRTRPKLHATLVVVKGSELELERVKEATMHTINLMCKNLAGDVFVQMMMEISPQHHSFVLGENSNNLKMIMYVTSCQIMFPDAEDPNIPSIKKSNITITGKIDNVYNARQMLLGCLPLVLMFDIPNASLVDDGTVSMLMNLLGVHINVRSKPKQSTLSVIVRAVERHASKIYEARHKLLQLEGSPICAAIPETYHIPIDPVDFNRLVPVNPGYGFFPQSSMPPMWGAVSPGFNHLFPPQLMPYGLSHGFMPMLTNPASSGYGRGLFPQRQDNMMLPDFSGSKDAYSSLSSNTSPLSSPCASPLNVSSTGTYSDPSVDYSKMVPDWSEYFFNMGRSRQEAAPESLPSRMQHAFNAGDYDEKKLQATRARQEQPMAGLHREPTSVWAGYGFSHSSPSVTAKHSSTVSSSTGQADPWNSPALTLTDFDNAAGSSLLASNILDAIPAKTLDHIANAKDITTLLSSLGLDKYIFTFTSHEIDLITFASLNEEDLREIGVSALGARRKMLVAISDLKSRKLFKVSLAPGAERKSFVGGTMDSQQDRNWQ